MIKIKTDSNYLAKIFKIKNIRKHENADRLQCISVDFNNVITDLKAKDGDYYIFFPVGSAIDPKLLSHLNCYKDSSLNRDQKVEGYFSSKGVVKAANLRSEKSEGFILPLREIESFYDCSGLDKYEGKYLDSIKDSLVCWKCEAVKKKEEISSNRKTRKLNKKVSRLVEHQFRLHEDTDQLGRNIHKFNLDDEISITSKWHGSNATLGRVRVKRNLTLLEKIAKFFGAKVQGEEYPNSDELPLYASRNVIKNRSFSDSGSGFYKFDFWTEIAKKYGDKIPKNFSIYGEIVGQSPDGRWIQRMKNQGFDYGVFPYSFDLFVFRVTFTNHDGHVYELGTEASKQFCDKYGLNFVPIFFLGTVRQFLLENGVDKFDSEEEWRSEFIRVIKEKYNEKDCEFCKNKVPEEGVVIVRQRLDKFEAYKQKSHRFLKMEVEQLESEEETLD